MAAKMVEEWRVTRSILDRIATETSADPDREICGLLLGSIGTVDAAIPCRNVAPTPAIRFEIDPAALLAAHRAARAGGRAGGQAVVGCYHSHPSGRAEPSPRDAADAAPDGGLWLIATFDAITAWRAVENGPLHGRFAPVRLRVAPSAAKQDAVS